MFYRQIQDNENIDMENHDMLSAQHINPMHENPMMQSPIHQNPMMQSPMMHNQMGSQWMPLMCYPMMSGMYNPQAYGSQMLQEEYEPREEIDGNMERAPYHRPPFYPGYLPYFYYFPLFNFNPLLIPLLFGRGDE